jgi:hypothetical protein
LRAFDELLCHKDPKTQSYLATDFTDDTDLHELTLLCQPGRNRQDLCSK